VAGTEFFTPDVAHELSSHFPEDELFSNQVLFILRPRHGPAMWPGNNECEARKRSLSTLVTTY